MQKIQLAGVLLTQAKGFTAHCPDVDVYADGATPAKAKRGLRESIEIYLDATIASDKPWRRPVSRGEDPRRTYPDAVVEKFSIKCSYSGQLK
ncbi:MAG: hypothetical protein HY078_12990 [Elusimicrobia bacterium]|nr:hypothetical protein [Elusimicrobiota bacterium]